MAYLSELIGLLQNNYAQSLAKATDGAGQPTQATTDNAHAQRLRHLLDWRHTRSLLLEARDVKITST
jgi:hypothetical protein